MKANFKISKNDGIENNKKNIKTEDKKEATEEEFEEFLIKAGAAGSFMVFRSEKNKESELGLDEL